MMVEGEQLEEVGKLFGVERKGDRDHELRQRIVYRYQWAPYPPKKYDPYYE